jgi:hypothetical protein
MAHTPHAFENSIFEAYRVDQKKVQAAISLLKEHGYVVFKKDAQL